MVENKNIQEDEIDLRELFQIIWKRKLFIIVFTFIITLLSGIYIYKKNPIYEVKSFIEIGYINQNMLEDINALEQKLKVIFSVEENKIEESYEKGIVTSIKQIKGVKNFLEIKTEGYSNEIALLKNQEVLKLIQSLLEPKIKEYEVILDNDILNTKREVEYIKEVEMKNILSQINILKEQEIKNIDKKINILKTQNIPLIKNQIEFLSKKKIKTIEDKISFYTKSIDKYQYEMNLINKSINKTQDTSSLIASMQTLNYENLMINTQNKIKDLELEIDSIIKDEIPKLKNELENINEVQIRDLENKKQNISNETIRKLEDKINIELKTKITQLNEKVETLNFKKSEQNLSNSKLIGNYVINNNPTKPKKSLVILVSFVTSFIFSIFIVLISNFFSNSKIVIKEDKI